MKINVVVDMKGTVVGIFRQEFQDKGGAKIQAGVTLKPGHSIHQIEVDDKIMKQSAVKVHEAVQKITIARLGQGFHLKK